ncbi:GMP/IMP nucleotidase [Pleionea sp. CnH1-48]|uniref:GMP/IMP nucleotidase n=1 Tax=Pleionea sp. CnH1-48 TaxID=2954494 RepID=UPI002096BAA4|nr:GMP/IMP nucleotidase [Pleionea sp. CnH1-48]MCO7225193.1 GMP/IMP nucleotidase [Pleionea sp. CnH1-48]
MLDWQKIDTVLLDMDGTILDLHFDNYFWLHHLPSVYAEQNNISQDESRRYLMSLFDSLRGTLNWYCLDFWTEKLKLDIVALKYDIQTKITFRPQALEFLQALNRLEKKVYLVTNAHPKSLEVKLLNADFTQYFEQLITSHDFGYPKEEQQFWHDLRTKLSFDKQRTLFIDDSVSVLESAHKYGIQHLFGIAKPDSQQPEKSMEPFVALHQFSEIIKL